MLQLGKKYYIGSDFQRKVLENLKNDKIVGIRCGSCHRAYFPPRFICPHCYKENKSRHWETLSGIGRVYSVTTVFYPPAGFEAEAPFSLAVVLLDDGPKILCRTDEKLTIGDIVMIKAKIEKNAVYFQAKRGSDYEARK